MKASVAGALPSPDAVGHFKDAGLDAIARTANVAQFVSYAPGAEPFPRYSRIAGYPPNHKFETPREAVSALLAHSASGSVNVRSFLPAQPENSEFVYGLRQIDEVLKAMLRLARQGLYTIVNETIETTDGGVSGVLYGGVAEFAPDDTPRCVEGPGTLSLPASIARRLLAHVYQVEPALDYPTNIRVEFSVHPLGRGFRNDHTIVWEIEETEPVQLEARVLWPNRFSRLIGDKAFGLLIADLLDLPVPKTVVISRRLAPFGFGRRTGTADIWIRTCPREQTPGRFMTQRGWIDPFSFMASEDPKGELLASVLAQEGVDAAYSGALVTLGNGRVVIEGVKGEGMEFMSGRVAPGALPLPVRKAVRGLWERARAVLGPVRMEWVFDGAMAWIVQVHSGGVRAKDRRTIYPGQARRFHRFYAKDGLDALRALAERIRGSGEGIAVVGSVGLTSHFGDVLRRERIPSVLEGE